MGRLSKAAKKRREAEIRKAVREAVAANENSGRVTQLENTLSTIQQLIHAVLKPQQIATAGFPKPAIQAYEPPPSLLDAVRNPLFDNMPDEPISADPAELDDGDDLGEGRWL